MLTVEWNDEYIVGHDGTGHAFALIAGIGFAPRPSPGLGSHVVVLDRMERSVTVWDDGGTKIQQWGGPGDGPGEFKNPNTLAVSGSGVVAVSDGSEVTLNRVAGGSSVRSISLPDLTLAFQPVFDSSGRVSVLSVNMMAAMSGNVELRLLRVDDHEVLWKVTARTFLSQRLFRPRPVLVRLSGDRVAVGLDFRYRLDIVDLNTGEELGRLGRNLLNRRIARDFRAKLRRYLMNPSEAPAGWSSLLPSGSLEAFTQADVDQIEFPDVFPAIVHAFRGPPGETVWVRRGLGVNDELASPVDPPDGGEPMWDLFDAETYRYMGTVKMPEGFIPYAGDSFRLAGVQTTAMGVQALRVARVGIR